MLSLMLQTSGALISQMSDLDPASYLTEANSIVVDNDGTGNSVVNAKFDVVDTAWRISCRHNFNCYRRM